MQSDLHLLLLIIITVLGGYVLFNLLRRYKSRDLYIQPEIVHLADPLMEDIEEKEEQKEEITFPDFIALTIVPKQNNFSGHLLQFALRTNHFYFDQGLFNYHLNQDPQDTKLFSILSLIEPGTFQFNRMPYQTFAGVVILMTLKPPPLSQALDTMLTVGRQLATILNGELRSYRKPLTDDLIEQYHLWVGQSHLREAREYL